MKMNEKPDMALLYEFCRGLCLDEQSKVNLRNICDNITSDVCRIILEQFSTLTLAQQIHPIQRDDIFMASHKSYRSYMRRERSLVGKATNTSTINVLRNINDFLSKSNSGCKCKRSTLSELVNMHLNFPPSKLFMTNLDGLHLETC